MIENIYDNDNKLIAIIVKNGYSNEGVNFLTPDDFSQQLGFIKHSKGKIIEPHVHNVVTREVFYTKEVLFVKKGSLRVDFYNDNKEYLKSKILNSGDVILLAKGGHGFEVIEDVELFEVKQGPYVGENDKTRFKYDQTKINKIEE